MSNPHAEIEAAIQEASRAYKAINSKRTKQVGASEEIGLLKATAFAWLRQHRKSIVGSVGQEAVQEVDKSYQEILVAAERYSVRSGYLFKLKAVKERLVQLRSEPSLYDWTEVEDGSDLPPDYSPLIADPAMQAILRRRWEETVACLRAGAHLAATVMMGGLLEGLLLARLNRLTDKGPVFTAKAAPRDKQGKALPLKEWTLKDYIDVAHELKWISAGAKSVGEVLRDYRNYIHPQKELSHGVHIGEPDSRVFWNISKTITLQVISSV